MLLQVIRCAIRVCAREDDVKFVSVLSTYFGLWEEQTATYWLWDTLVCGFLQMTNTPLISRNSVSGYELIMCWDFPLLNVNKYKFGYYFEPISALYYIHKSIFFNHFRTFPKKKISPNLFMIIWQSNWCLTAELLNLELIIGRETVATSFCGECRHNKTTALMFPDVLAWFIHLEERTWPILSYVIKSFAF